MKLSHEQFGTLTVAELIEQLQELPPDALIAFSTNYGDYSRTMQVLPFGNEPEEVLIEESAYSHSGFAISRQEPNDEPEDEDEEEQGQRVYVIRS